MVEARAKANRRQIVGLRRQKISHSRNGAVAVINLCMCDPNWASQQVINIKKTRMRLHLHKSGGVVILCPPRLCTLPHAIWQCWVQCWVQCCVQDYVCSTMCAVLCMQYYVYSAGYSAVYTVLGIVLCAVLCVRYWVQCWVTSSTT